MERLPPEVLRIIDANINRAVEGLRVLEEIARLVLDDADLTRQLKEMRHELVAGDWSLQVPPLNARDSDADVGADLEVPGAGKQSGLTDTVVANSRRVQESLRVLEEMARVPGVSIPTAKFRKARFSLYSMEKVLMSRLLRHDKIARLRGLYTVIDIPFLKDRDYLDAAKQTILGGARAIQLRDKVHGRKELLPIARALKELCAERGVLFIVNDYLDLALAADADGVHLGQDDLPAEAARKLLPIDKLLGVSVCTVEEATKAQAAGADYIGVAAIFPTGSKEAVGVVGCAGLRRIRQAVALPLVAIGGINKDNTDEAIAAGAVSVAVISAVLGANDIAQSSRQIAERFKDERSN